MRDVLLLAATIGFMIYGCSIADKAGRFFSKNLKRTKKKHSEEE